MLQPSEHGNIWRVNESENTALMEVIAELLPYSPYNITIAAVNDIGSSGTASTIISTTSTGKSKFHTSFLHNKMLLFNL